MIFEGNNQDFVAFSKTFTHLIHFHVLGIFAWLFQRLSCLVGTGPKNDQQSTQVYISKFHVVIV